MSNSLSNVIPQLLAGGLMALRQQSIMARLVNRSYESMAAEPGQTVDIPIPSALTVTDVTAQATPRGVTNLSPTKVQLSLTSWKEAAFVLSDKEVKEVVPGVMPMQASEAAKALANQVDGDILNEYKGVYGYAGTAGTTPFGSNLSEYATARQKLAEQLAPMDDRRVVMDPAAEANAIQLRAFQDASYGGGQGVILRGQIGTKIGADWYVDQNVKTHTKGTLSGSAAGGAGKALINGAVAAGAATLNLDDTTLTGTIVQGDVFTVAGDTQTYTVTNTSTLTASGNAITGVTFSPTCVAGFDNNAVLTLKGTHVVNLLFHRDAFALAVRPLDEGIRGLGSEIRVMTDPVSGLALRLEVSREHKRTRFSYDILYGVKLVRAELATRIAG